MTLSNVWRWINTNSSQKLPKHKRGVKEPFSAHFCLSSIWSGTFVLRKHETPSVTEKWGPAVHHSKDKEEARLVERKVCFTLDAGNWGGVGRLLSCLKADSPCPDNQWARAFIGRGMGLQAETGYRHCQLWQSSRNWSFVVWPASSWLF